MEPCVCWIEPEVAPNLSLGMYVVVASSLEISL